MGQGQRVQEREDWDNLSATLNQITKLQPNFITVWEFQAHNLSYNVSVEFDDYRQRYHWVKKGISFLIDGTHHNRDNPRLLHQTAGSSGRRSAGRTSTSSSAGCSARTRISTTSCSRSVAVDDAKGYDGRPDNWLVGRLWYLRAYEAVDAKGMPLRGKSPLIFHADGPMSLINYASDIEEEGILGQAARRAWQEPARAGPSTARRPIPTSWGHNIRLGDLAAVGPRPRN